MSQPAPVGPPARNVGTFFTGMFGAVGAGCGCLLLILIIVVVFVAMASGQHPSNS